MAKGRTISANFLTDLDKKVLKLCEIISLKIKSKIKNDKLKKDFWNKFGKINLSRDAGAGRGGENYKEMPCV